LGTHKAGFNHEVIIECDLDTCITIKTNQERGLNPIQQWRLFDNDVKLFDYSQIKPNIDLISGGPPCQPFSMGGKHKAYLDERDMFPEAVRAVRELQPKSFLFENVKGLTRDKFNRYFTYVQLQLTYPEITCKRDEDWTDHLARLEQHHTQGNDQGLSYRVVSRLINAADYGIPQRRERVFIVGFRSDIHQAWAFPKATHSQEALLWSQWVSCEYWDKHSIARSAILEPKSEARINKMRADEAVLEHLPWVTVRDTISDLPDPEKGDSNSGRILNHEYRPGAKAYKGHTGSPLDEPAKALKAGDHGVPGGENMMVLPDGRVRYFTVRESARLQCFPDEYFFPVSWTESMRQLGNAVPVTLGHKIAASIQEVLRTVHVV
jgi:DNA (cytosine-5)-methyltransferase 1